MTSEHARVLPQYAYRAPRFSWCQFFRMLFVDDLSAREHHLWWWRDVEKRKGGVITSWHQWDDNHRTLYFARALVGWRGAILSDYELKDTQWSGTSPTLPTGRVVMDAKSGKKYFEGHDTEGIYWPEHTHGYESYERSLTADDLA